MPRNAVSRKERAPEGAACHRFGVTDLRASDADRERVVDALRRHHGDGRITSDELDERIGAVWASKHVSELATITSDLPDLDPAPPPAPAATAPRNLPRGPGRRGFSAHWRMATSPTAVMVEVLGDVAPRLADVGYRLTERHGDRVVFARRRMPGWVWIPAILLFPFGLLALFARTEDRIAVELLPQPDGSTVVYAGGVAPLHIRRAFAELEG